MAMRKFQVLKAAAWLGWQIDANWADIMVFMTYTVIRPAFGMLTFAFMYLATSAAGPQDPSKLAYLLVGSSLFNYAASALWSSFFAVHEDREHYLTIRYLYIAPSNFTLYYLGRIAAPVLFSSSVSVVVNLTAGVLLLGMKVNPTPQTLSLLLISIPVVMLGFVGYSLLMAGISLFTTRYIWGLVEGLSGISFLLGGILFPPGVLPPEVRWTSNVMPWYYWIEMLRAPIVGHGISPHFMLIGATFSAVFLGLGLIGFNFSLDRARINGTLDVVTNW